jgi:hypothetical protein
MVQTAKDKFLPFTDNMEIKNSLKFSPHKKSLRRYIGPTFHAVQVGTLPSFQQKPDRISQSL